MTAPRVHPDDMVRRCYWSAQPKVPSATRIATTVRQCAPSCAREGCSSTVWVAKTTTGHGRARRKLPEPIPVCGHCGEEWQAEDVVNHMVTGAPGSGITSRGKWTRYVHVRAVRPPGSSTEERIFGGVDMLELHRLRDIANAQLRARAYYWSTRVYFAYVLHFEHVRGHGGERALASWAANRANGRHRAEAWPRAPFAWTRWRVAVLINAGRREWARRLARAGIIEGGEWWQPSTGETQHSR